MVRINMVGGTWFEVDAEINDIKEEIRKCQSLWNEQGHQRWVEFNDRNDNGHRVRIDHIVHIQEVQW